MCRRVSCVNASQTYYTYDVGTVQRGGVSFGRYKRSNEILFVTPHNSYVYSSKSHNQSFHNSLILLPKPFKVVPKTHQHMRVHKKIKKKKMSLTFFGIKNNNFFIIIAHKINRQ